MDFALLRSTIPGNAKASIRGTGNKDSSTSFFIAVFLNKNSYLQTIEDANTGMPMDTDAKKTHTIILNSRDELSIIDLNKIVYFQACGNYTKLYYSNGVETLISVGLSKCGELVSTATPPGAKTSFYRLGRSLIINQQYLHHINVLHQRLILMGEGSNTFTIEVPKAILKAYKSLLYKNLSKN